MAFAQAIARVYARHGLSAVRALAMAQIKPADLALPQARITAWQMETLSGEAMRELDDEALGAFSRRLPWGSYGMLARASISSPTLGIALTRWCRHHGLLTDDVQLAVSVNGDEAAITATDRRAPGEDPEFGWVHLMRNIHGLACWYLDSRIALIGASFPFAAPVHADAYPAMFPGALQFNAPRAELRLDARYLALPLRRDEKALQQMLMRALPLTVLQYRRDRLLVQQVRQALTQALPQPHTTETLATLLLTSPRSLHRQLRTEGASLQQLKDQSRSDLAKSLLLHTSKPIKQVAAASGFQNEKSFSRAFSQWCGVSPTAFRLGAMPDKS